MTESTLRLHLWFENAKGTLFGPGRFILLQKTMEHGSLNKAAKDLGMSYRAAWGKMKQTEQALGVSLLAKKEGRKNFQLSELGQELVDNYQQLMTEVEEFALYRSRKMFPWQITPYIKNQE